MLTTKVTPVMITECKQIFKNYRNKLHPNRRTGTEVDKYYKSKYPYQVLNNDRFWQVLMLTL